MTKLVFTTPQTTSTKLVFGGEATAAPPPPPPPVNTKAWRPLVVTVGAKQQQASATTSSITATLQTAQRAVLTNTTRLQQANACALTVNQRLKQAQTVHLSARARQQTARTLGIGVVLLWQSGSASAVAATTRLQVGVAVSTNTQFRFQSGIPVSRVLTQRLQQGAPVLLVQVARLARGVIAAHGLMARLQDGTWLQAGESYHPPLPPPPPCYTPPAGDAVRLVFKDAVAANARLVFWCRGGRPSNLQPAVLVIPIAKAYIMINNIALRRTTDNQPLAALGFGMRLDKDAYTWSFNATLPASMLPFIHDSNQAKPLAITATVQGAEYKLLVTRVGRTESFGDDVIAIQGKGIAAVLGQPYAPSRSFNNTAARTAQQLTADVLTNNGVGIGWTVDWFLTDWLVPAAAWSHQGTYISALADIASAVGGYVQPHATANKLLLKPLYPHKPWELATATPDVELPASAAEVVQTDWIEHPEYNAIYVSGQSMGKLGKVKRQGTAGDKHMPMVTHPLITAVEAVTQRGLAELGSQGKKTMRQIKTPVFNDVGVIVPGTTLRYVDKHGQPFTGITRSVSVDGNNMPVLTQTVGVEFHGEQT